MEELQEHLAEALSQCINIEMKLPLHCLCHQSKW